MPDNYMYMHFLQEFGKACEHSQKCILRMIIDTRDNNIIPSVNYHAQNTFSHKF